MKRFKAIFSALMASSALLFTFPGSAQEIPDLAATYEDFFVPAEEIDGRLDILITLVDENETDVMEMGLSEAVWNIEALMNYAFRGHPRVPKNVQTVRGSSSLGLVTRNGDLATVSTTKVLDSFNDILLSIEDRITDTREWVLIFDSWAVLEGESAVLKYDVILAAAGSAPPPPLGNGDNWKACNQGHCGGGSPPVTATGAEGRLEDIFNYENYSSLNLPTGGTFPFHWITLCEQGTQPFMVNAFSKQYDPTVSQLGSPPAYASDYNSGGLFHSYNTSYCRNTGEMQAHKNFLTTLAGSFGYFGPCQNPGCVRFQLLEIEKYLFKDNEPTYSSFNYLQNAWVIQWRPIFRYGSIHCPGPAH